MSFLKKPSSSRYNSFDSRSSTQSHQSDPSSSTDKRLPLVKTKPSEIAQGRVHDQNFSSMVKKFMEKKSSSAKIRTANRGGLVIPADFIAEDLKKTARKGTNFSGLHKKLFSKGLGSGKDGTEVKALTEVRSNTRSLAMVLRSERELLTLNKDQELEIAELKLLLQDKNTEVEKLKDLCLNQREEIKALKNALLFPDVTSSQLQELLQKQGSELIQAKQLIPSLQRQVTSLTDQLQCLADDLAEVKADKHPVRGCYDNHVSSPRTPTYDHQEAANSLEFSSEDQTTPGSPDDMFLKDLNPCLTPYYANTKSKEFDAMGYDSPHYDEVSENNKQLCHKIDFESCSKSKKVSKSSDCCQCSSPSNPRSTSAQASRRSDGPKFTYGKPMHHTLF